MQGTFTKTPPFRANTMWSTQNTIKPIPCFHQLPHESFVPKVWQLQSVKCHILTIFVTLIRTDTTLSPNQKTKKWFVIMYTCMCVCVHPKDVRQVLDPLELELQAIVSYLIWLSGNELGSSTRTVSRRNCWAFNLASEMMYFKNRILKCLEMIMTKCWGLVLGLHT